MNSHDGHVGIVDTYEDVELSSGMMCVRNFINVSSLIWRRTDERM